MDVNAIIQAITTLGFPIVACSALFWYVNKQEERRKDEVEGLKEALNENSKILTALKDLINLMLNKGEWYDSRRKM